MEGKLGVRDSGIYKQPPFGSALGAIFHCRWHAFPGNKIQGLDASNSLTGGLFLLCFLVTDLLLVSTTVWKHQCCLTRNDKAINSKSDGIIIAGGILFPNDSRSLSPYGSFFKSTEHQCVSRKYVQVLLDLQGKWKLMEYTQEVACKGWAVSYTYYSEDGWKLNSVDEKDSRKPKDADVHSWISLRGKSTCLHGNLYCGKNNE